jgi:4-amino-4-deoxy-L-arabinose transferase-like glycosyltransferase
MTGNRSRSPFEWTLITLILLVAAVLRFHDLGDIPKGLEHDEVATWHMVDRVLNGDVVLYFEEGYGHEPLFNYLTALPMAVLGHNWLGERFWAPWFGMFAVAATYALMRRMFNALVGLSAAGFQAIVLWALFFNRLGLRLNQLPFLLCVTAYCFWRGCELASSELRVGGGSQGTGARDRKPDEQDVTSSGLPSAVSGRQFAWFVAAGALMGLCFYTYMSSRVVPVIFGAFSVYLVVHERWLKSAEAGNRLGWGEIGRRWWPILVSFAVAILVMVPLVLYLLNRPATAIPQREEQVDRPLQELRDGNLKPVLENAWALIKMWNVDGERYWQLNYSHRPVFVEPISGALFWMGAVIVLWRWRDPRMALLLAWTGLGMVPSLLTSGAPSWPRTMLASPAALTLPGIAVSTTVQWLRSPKQRLPSLFLFAHHTVVALLVLSLILTAILTYRDFLVLWPRHPRVRYAFQSSMTEAFRYLDAAEDATPVVMAGLSPHDVDPWTERCTLRRRDLHVRWVDTRSALVLPAGDAARLVTLDITPVEPVLADWAGLTPEATISKGKVVPRGGMEAHADAPVYYDPAYTVYLLDVAALRQRIEDDTLEAFVGADAFEPLPLSGAPQFEGLVRLYGYAWLTAPRPGSAAQLLTFWLALDTGPGATRFGEPALRTFVHLLDRERRVVQGATVDVLGSAPDTWLAGDVIVQYHALVYPSDPGTYAVELGWYVPPDGPRLTIDGVDAPGQRILLPPVEVGE